MAWYRTGNVAVAASDTVVTGTGTLFATHVRVGDGFVGPDGRMYEVTNIASETVLSIFPPYQGATATGQDYSIIPVQGYPKRLADRAGVLVDEVGELPGRIDDIDDVLAELGSAAGANMPAGVTEFGTAAGATLVASQDDPAEGRVPVNGWMGIGARRVRNAPDIDVAPPGSGFSYLVSPMGGIDQSGHLIDMLGDAPGSFAQIFIDALAGEMKHRLGTEGAPGVLRTLFDTGNCTYTTNSNGGVWRFKRPFKLQICFMRGLIQGNTAQAAGNIFRDASERVWIFPAAFSGIPFTAGNTFIAGRWVAAPNASSTYGAYTMYGTHESASGSAIYAVAIGEY